MCELKLYGGTPLKGQLRVQGSKNSALPILAAALLAEDPCEITNCPDLTDVRAAFAILRHLGCSVAYDGCTARVDASNASGTHVPEDLMGQMRSSVMFLGAILGRCRQARISCPGGCELGARPIDIHLRALARLGVTLTETEGDIHCRLEQFRPQTLTLMFPSVGATENLLLLCAVSPGETVLVNPAREPEIVDLQNFLNRMGARITGAGSDVIRIRGVSRLRGCSYQVVPDRIAAATYACAVAACGGEALLTHVEPAHLRLPLAVLRDMGMQAEPEEERLWLRMQGRPLPVPSIRTMPYPGFPTDAQAPFMAALLRARGASVFTETIFESRFKHVGGFRQMGASIQVEGMNAVVQGVPALHGAAVTAADLRGGAALAVAGLAAEGVTVVRGVEHIRRGYQDIAGALGQLGARAEMTEN